MLALYLKHVNTTPSSGENNKVEFLLNNEQTPNYGTISCELKPEINITS